MEMSLFWGFKRVLMDFHGQACLPQAAVLNMKTRWLTRKISLAGCSKRARCKAPEILRSEPYFGGYAATTKDLPAQAGETLQMAIFQ
jgi:hypothetical protein